MADDNRPGLSARRAAGPRVPAAQNATKTIVLERKLQFVTLMHGGGPISSQEENVQARLRNNQPPMREPDPRTAVRGTSLRGQLRFWWRATHGCTSASVAAMREREDLIWGNASKPGRVDLQVTPSLTKAAVPVDGLGYGAFATRNLTRLTGTFKVEVSLHAVGELQAEINDALDAWVLFGGLGGRTRRGFGSVSASAALDPEQFLNTLANGPETLVRVPTLRRGTLAISDGHFDQSEEAHKAAVGALRSFRQQPGLGRNEGAGTRPGRSRWPEPDTIRRQTGLHASGHAPEHPVIALPRAAFGMPIVFHFMGPGEPRDPTLAPSPKGGRMASPLLLRPALVGGKWRAMALRLHVPGLDLSNVYLKDDNRPLHGTITAEQALQIKPLADNGGHADPITAFLHYFRNTL